jgi:hypothetical protein
MIDIRNNTTNMKNRILAIEAAPAAMPKKPKTPATIAITRNMIVQRSIIIIFLVKQFVFLYTS